MKSLLSLFIIFTLFLTIGCDTGTKEDAPTADQEAPTTNEEAPAETAESTPKEAVKKEAPSGDTETRLINFFKSKFGTRLPGNTEVKLGEFESSDIEGIDKGLRVG